MRSFKIPLLFLAFFFIYIMYSNGQGKANAFYRKVSKDTTVVKTIEIDLKNIDTIGQYLKPKERSFISEWGTVMVAIIAIGISLVTSLFSLRVSKKNVIAQIEASQKNILTQINGNKELEVDKKKLEILHKNNLDLKEYVAKFIKEAQKINEVVSIIKQSSQEEKIDKEFVSRFALKYNADIFSGLENIVDEQTKKINIGQYDFFMAKKEQKRELITDIYYSIKVSLNSTPKHKALEKILDRYMTITFFREDVFKLTDIQEYGDCIANLYHTIKSIIHEDYREVS
jgi:hypothetical protein